MVTYSNRIHRSVPPLPNEDISVDIEEEEEDGSASGHETIGKESRGPTYMSDIRGRPLNLPLISVEYNEFGQPIGGEKSKLCHFLAMVERSSQLPEGVEDQIAPNDISAQIMEKDKPGHVRMMGKGVCPTDVWSGTPRSTSDRLLIEYKDKIARLEAMLASKQRPQASQADIRPDVTNSKSLSSQATTQADMISFRD
ncbi:hypothetical protein SASPL_105337 [Salvia splendens]|uniref:Uncharacterized protein n=1 Tax=Salvia splendens TaxID=180675 RepID=A0A8X9A984_SALSN|nr:hypothetical protein SASPL_105337 [Salvia splendens]